MRQLTAVLVLIHLAVLPAQAADCFRDRIGLDPVRITRTLAQEAAGVRAASEIVPRALDGTPDSRGAVVFLGVGMSNTSSIWKSFRAALNAAGTAPSTLRWLNGAQGGQGAPQWADPTCTCWTKLDAKVAKRASHAQVQAIFLMLATPRPWQSPEDNAVRFAQNVEAVLVQLETRFPNLRLVYIAANSYGGYDTNQDKTPEPHHYQENLALQGLQDGHIGSAWVSASSSMMWSDGVRPRAWDGLTLLCPDDVTRGGVHLSSIGKVKYGGWLYNSLMSDQTTAGWMR